MVLRARLTVAIAATALAAVAPLWLATPGARGQEGDPSPAEALCTPESDRDPMPDVVVRTLGLYYGSATLDGKDAAAGADTTSLIPQALADAIIAGSPDARITDGLGRRVSPSLDAVTWVQANAPDEDAYTNLVRYWGTLLAKDATLEADPPEERGTLYFKVAEWEASSGGIVPVLTPTCGVAAVTFFVVSAAVTLPGDDVDPDLFPPTPTPRPIAVFDPPPPNPVTRPGATATPTRTPTPVRTILGSPVSTPTPRVNDDDVAGVITGGATATPQPIPTPRPPSTGAGAQTGSASPLVLAAVALLSGSAGLLAASRRRR